MSSNKQTFESFIMEFRENRENVINIIKIVLEQKKVAEFQSFLKIKKEENQKLMKDFVKSKYYEFVESLENINECKGVIRVTDEILLQLETGVQAFLSDFSVNYIDKMRKKEDLQILKEEKEKLNKAYIFFAYINKADVALKEQQFEMSIRLMNNAVDKFLKQFPPNSSVYRRGEDLVNKLKTRITSTIEEKLAKWLVEINREQMLIGETLYKKVKSEQERYYKNEFFTSSPGEEGKMKSNIRTTKNIVDSLLLIRNTSNLNYMMNKNSVLKSSIQGQGDLVEEYDIINMVSNVDLKFLEQAYDIYKMVDVESKFLDYFRSYRQSQTQNLIKIEQKSNKNYDLFFSEILGFLIIQIAVFELHPVFYTKRKFEESMNYLIKELQSNLRDEFDTFRTAAEFMTFEKTIFIFIKCTERIGISDRIGIDIKSIMIEMMKDKIPTLNMMLIQKYNTLFGRLLIEEQCLTLKANNTDEFMKYVTQYSIVLEDEVNPMTRFIYPYHLPYTHFVIDVNENFKKYLDEIFEYIKPLYSEYEGIIPQVVRDFLKKLNEVFIYFANSQEHDLNIITVAQICNNIQYILKSHNFYIDHVRKLCGLQNNVTFYTDRPLKQAAQAYQEIIFENLKKKIRQFLSDLKGDDWMPEKSRDKPSMYVDGLISYLNVLYVNLQTMSPYYVENCFKDALNFCSKLYCEILFDSNIVKNYNIKAIENLQIDIEALDAYFREINLTHPGFDQCLMPIKCLLSVFFTKRIESLYDKNFTKSIKVEDAIKFFMRFKNMKKSQSKGVISENDITNLIKKLKESLGK